MKYIIIPIARFIYFLIGGSIWCVLWVIYFIWNLKPIDTKIYPFKHSVFGWSSGNWRYETPLDYLLKRDSYEE